MISNSNKITSLKDILKSSIMIGGSQVINIISVLIKNKFIALFLGPSGIGLIGLYITFSMMVTNFIGFGVSSSSPKFIAELSGDIEKQQLFILLTRNFLVITSAITLVVLPLFNHRLVSIPQQYENVIVYILLAGVIFFDNLSAGERAILQGLRQIRKIAKLQIIAGILVAAFTITIIFYFKERGIVLSLFLSSFITYIIIRGFNLKFTFLNIFSFKKNLTELLGLGFVFLVTTVWGTVVAYLIRFILLKNSGIEAVGIYQSSWGFVTSSFTIVLVALGTDLYPRLASLLNSKVEFNNAINEQVEVAIYLAIPLLIFAYLFSPWLITLLYSSAFLQGVELTRWLIFSCFFQILCWPLSYIIILKGSKLLFFSTSILWEVIHLPLILICLKHWGIAGIGVSYVLSYIIVAIGSYIICSKYFLFKWSRKLLLLIFFSIVILLLINCLNYLNISKIYFYLLGSVLLVSTTILSVSIFIRILKPKIANRKIFKYLPN